MMYSMKRARNEDEEELEELRNDYKRPRILPFRASPTTKHSHSFSESPRHKPEPLLLTPVDSSEDEDDSPYPARKNKASTQAFAGFASYSQDQFTIRQNTDYDADSDFEMAESQPAETPLWNRMQLSPAMSPHTSYITFQEPEKKAQTPRLNINTRIPTPIYGHFTSSLKDNLPDAVNAGGEITPDSANGYACNYIHNPTFATLQAQRTQQDLAHHQFLRRRQFTQGNLPISPISEDEKMDSEPLVTINEIQTPTENISMDLGEAVSAQQQPESKPSNPSTSSFRRGWGAVGSAAKVVFSMGYRADCEKCRTRVPGHWSHVVKV